MDLGAVQVKPIEQMEKQSLFLSLYSMILADGIVNAQELEHLYKIATERLGLNRQDVDKYLLSAGTVSPIVKTFDEKITHLCLLAEMAWVDGVVDDNEKALMRRYVLNYDFEEVNADGIVDFILDRVKNNKSIAEVIAEAKEMED